MNELDESWKKYLSTKNDDEYLDFVLMNSLDKALKKEKALECAVCGKKYSSVLMWIMADGYFCSKECIGIYYHRKEKEQ